LSRVSRLDTAMWAAGQLGMRGFIEALGRVHAKRWKKTHPRRATESCFAGRNCLATGSGKESVVRVRGRATVVKRLALVAECSVAEGCARWRGVCTWRGWLWRGVSRWLLVAVSWVREDSTKYHGGRGQRAEAGAGPRDGMRMWMGMASKASRWTSAAAPEPPDGLEKRGSR
jgi:hypothetical protein